VLEVQYGVFVPDGEWDGRPLYTSTMEGSDDALFWCRQDDSWYFTVAYKSRSADQKKSGNSLYYARRQADGGRVPVDAAAQTWQCDIANKWQDKPVIVRALRTQAERDAAEAEVAAKMEAEAAQLVCEQAATVRPTCI
jgi:hypothetical protein